MKPLSVLVVDDDEPTRRVLQLWLQSHGHRATCVDGGNKALEWLRAHEIDLVITDVLMADGNGIDLIGHMKRARPKIRVLAITGGGPEATSSSCLHRAYLAGAHALLLKPFQQDQLSKAMRYVLGLADDYHSDPSDRTVVKPTPQVRLFAGVAGTTATV
jgi:DNA-binding NtrC family response regulator